ncbi:MAG TPA: ABC transporter permease [Micromonosporaceae bacterium]|jgi:ABC-type nitrate/sulfonate/bicarbonate transport system permease component|nr:ABC transporter permease [Mycobacterium sp.]
MAAVLAGVRAVAHRLVVPALAVLAWYVIAKRELVSPVFLPTPGGVLAAARDMWRADTLGEATRYTLGSALSGWIIACVLGVVVAIVITRNRFLVDALAPPLDFVRSLPAAALIPPATLLFGFGRAMEIPVVVLGAIWPVLLNATQGLLETEPQLHDVARSIRLSRLRRVYSIELPAALPAILLGVRTALSVAVIVAVVAEMVGSSGGLGYELILASQRFQSGEVYALVFLLGAIGVAANALVHALERRIVSRPGSLSTTTDSDN